MDEAVLGAIVAGVVVPAAALGGLLLLPHTTVTAVLGALALSKATAGAYTAIAAARSNGNMDRALESFTAYVEAIRWASAISCGIWIACVAPLPLLASAVFMPSSIALSHIEMFVFRVRKPVPESPWIWLRNFGMLLCVVFAGALLRRAPGR
jgi:hypothetical protein